MKKMFSLFLVLCLCFCMVVSASAAEIGSSGGSGTTPVNLTTTNNGIGDGGGSVTPTKLNVVVPTSLPMAMSDDGTVVTATDCKVINNSYGAVRIKSVTITAANDWHLTAFGDKASLAGEKVDANKLGFAMSIGGGSQVKTNSNAATQALISTPITGCFMTGVGDSAHNFASIEYAAIVTPLSSAVSGATVANIVIVVEWDTVS